MQVILVPDSLALLTLLVWLADCLAPIRPPFWMAAILQYGESAQFLFILFFCLNYNLTFNFAILQYGY
jgi:hypothetical protein